MCREERDAINASCFKPFFGVDRSAARRISAFIFDSAAESRDFADFRGGCRLVKKIKRSLDSQRPVDKPNDFESSREDSGLTFLTPIYLASGHAKTRCIPSVLP